MDFRMVWVLVFFVPFVYVFLVGKSAYKAKKVDERSRGNYFDAVKTMVTAAGVAIAIVAAGFQQKFSAPVWILRWATVCLSLCVMLSVTTMLEMSRSYEQARQLKDQPVRLRSLISVLVLGYLSLVTFLLGFAYLARLTFYM
jgi:hypothetical protein